MKMKYTGASQHRNDCQTRIDRMLVQVPGQGLNTFHFAAIDQKPSDVPGPADAVLVMDFSVLSLDIVLPQTDHRGKALRQAALVQCLGGSQPRLGEGPVFDFCQQELQRLIALEGIDQIDKSGTAGAHLARPGAFDQNGQSVLRIPLCQPTSHLAAVLIAAFGYFRQESFLALLFQFTVPPQNLFLWLPGFLILPKADTRDLL